MTLQPAEARCERCQQRRPLFPYKPLHDCIALIGPVGLVEAARHIAWFEEKGDRWCEARLEYRRHRLCVRCHDLEANEEATFIKEEEL
ncbi:hypothetical protein [Streptomyces ehimensis]|uniref:HNH endonuclease n=1 Tax=Streptomyces ehimensis TaxID=68195 RepID=A0ABV9BF05_9ACTN